MHSAQKMDRLRFWAFRYIYSLLRRQSFYRSQSHLKLSASREQFYLIMLPFQPRLDHCCYHFRLECPRCFHALFIIDLSRRIRSLKYFLLYFNNDLCAFTLYRAEQAMRFLSRYFFDISLDITVSIFFSVFDVCPLPIYSFCFGFLTLIAHNFLYTYLVSVFYWYYLLCVRHSDNNIT